MKIIKIGLLLLVGILLCNCKSIEMTSTPIKSPIQIDGMDTDSEWNGKRIFIEKEDIILGCQHDENYLYLLFISKDQDLERQMTMQGFTLWVNSQGKAKKEIGLKFPALERNNMQNRSEMRNRQNMQEDNMNDFRNNVAEKLAIKPELLEYINSKGKSYTVSLNEIKGFDFARNMDKRGLVYEFKIPLNKAENRFFTCNAESNDTYVIGLESCAPQREQSRSAQMGVRGGSKGGRGDQDMGGGRPQGMDQERPSGSGDSQKSFLKWIEITPEL